MITTVVFDLDDTLYPEIDYCRSGLRAVADWLTGASLVSSTAEVFDALWRQFTAGNRTRTFNQALQELGVTHDDDLIVRLVEVYRTHIPQIVLPRETRGVLTQLQDRYRLALLTDGFLPAQRLKVQALGIEQYFQAVIYTEELGRQFWKPSPVGFRRLLEALHTQREHAAYVADNETKDFIAPNKLGFVTIQLCHPLRLHTDPAPQAGAAAGHRIDTIAELPALLESL